MAVGVGNARKGAIVVFKNWMSKLRDEFEKISKLCAKEPSDFNENDLKDIQDFIECRYGLEKSIADDIASEIFAKDSLGDNYFVNDLLGNNYNFRFNLNAKDAAGRTMLTTASWKGNLDVVRVLINAKADVNVMDINHDTALILAASEGHLDVVRVLINAGADANVTNSHGETAVTVVMQMTREMYTILRVMNAMP